jgi:hypothetical protein
VENNSAFIQENGSRTIRTGEENLTLYRVQFTPALRAGELAGWYGFFHGENYSINKGRCSDQHH